MELVEDDAEEEGVGRVDADPEPPTGSMGVSSSTPPMEAIGVTDGLGSAGGPMLSSVGGGDMIVGVEGARRVGSTTTLFVETREFITGIEMGFIVLEISATSADGIPPESPLRTEELSAAAH